MSAAKKAEFDLLRTSSIQTAGNLEIPGQSKRRRACEILDLCRRRRPTLSLPRLSNACLLVGLGLGLPHNYLLQVRGRRSGQLYATPVDVLTHAGTRFVVAGRGNTQWVRNARVSGQVV